MAKQFRIINKKSGPLNITAANLEEVAPDIGAIVSFPGFTSLLADYAFTDNSTNWNTAYTDRFKWDGGSSGLVATTGRTSLGATTVGSNVFTLPNPSAITFLRFNANNTVSALNASDFRTAIGAGTSSTVGTVTSIAMSVPTGLAVTGSPITTSGTFGISLDTGYSIPLTANQVNWNTAYGWGDHGAAGYLTSYTETDPVFIASQAANITSQNITDLGNLSGVNSGDQDLSGYQTLELAKLKQDINTGFISGLQLSINADNTKFDIAAGYYVITDFTDLLNPVPQIINFAGVTGVTPTYLASANVSYIALNVGGTVIQSSSPFTNTQRRDLAIIGAVIHSNNSFINVVNQIKAPIVGDVNQLHDLMRVIGAINRVGNEYSANGANLSLNRSAGEVFGLGLNPDNPKDPSTLIIPEEILVSFRYRMSNGDESADTTLITPTQIESPLGTLVALSNNNKYSIQRINLFQSGLTRIQYGQKEYADFNDALLNVQTENFITEQNIAENAIFRAYLVMKKDVTDLAAAITAGTAKFIPVDKWGSVVGGAGIALTYDSILAALGFTPEDVANKQDSLTVDGTGVKYSTVDAVNAGLSGKEDKANKDVINGYAGLDGAGKINPSQLPALAITDTFVVGSQVLMLALTAETGDVAVRTDLNKSFILKGNDPTILADWQELLTPTDAVQSIFGRSGTVTAQANDYNADQILETATKVFVTPAEKTAITHTNRTALDLVSGTNTGDQDLSPYELLSNKKTDIEANKTSNIFYAPIKAFVDWVTLFFDGISEPKNIIVCDGDSRTAGYTGGVNYKYSDNLDLGTDFVIDNVATGGATLTDNEISSVRWIVKDAFNVVSRKKSKLATNNIVVIWAGYNDMSVNDKSAEIVFESLKSYCFSRKKEGWKVIVCTEPNNTNAIGEERRLVLNDLIRKNVFEIADGIADIGNSEYLGGDGDASNATYFFDGVHMTAAGYAQVALIVKSEILKLTGNNYKRLSADTTVVGDLASSTIETSPLLSLIRPSKDGTSFANMAAFYLGRYAGVGGAFEPFTKLDIKLKSTASVDLLTDKTVMSFKDNGDVIVPKLTSTFKKYTKTETDGTLTNANLIDEGVNCKMIDGRLYFQESGQRIRSIGIVAGTSTFSIYDETWSFSLLEIDPEGLAKFFKSVQVGDNTAVASASNVGAIRYRVSGNNSYAEISMQTGASTYEWTTLTVHSW